MSGIEVATGEFVKETPRPKALIIVGGKGSGKTKRAKELAGKNSVYLDYRSLGETGFSLAQLALEPDCVVVEDAPLSKVLSPFVEGLLTADRIAVELRHRNPVVVKAPKRWIFTVPASLEVFEMKVNAELFEVEVLTRRK